MQAKLDSEKPFRDELLSVERLDERARSLAARFTVDPARRSARSVFPRFDDNVRLLREAYRALADDVHRGEFVTAAGEWLLDNYHLVASEIRDVRQNLPRGYYRELPTLASRELVGTARVYALAVELIRHSDSRLDRAQLVRYLDAFQTVAPLTIGELWAWPSMLKLALVENLRRLAEETLAARAARRAADAYVARIDEAGKGVPPPLPRALHPALVVQLLQRVREYGPRLSAVRTGLDAHLAAQQTTAEEAIRGEHQREAAAQVSVANVFTSLRLCSTLDWSEYVESVSLVERVLQRDPAGVHGRMEFLSRDRYRQAVEELADRTGRGPGPRRPPSGGERAPGGGGRGAGRARRARRATTSSARGAASSRPTWPGAPASARACGGSRSPTRPRCTSARSRSRPPRSSPPGSRTPGTRAARRWAQLGVALLLLLPASEVAIALVQRLAARFAPPRRLPRLDLSAGIPEDARTLVVVPTLLTSVEGVERQLEHLEVLALGNLDPRIHFAILGDFADATARDMPGGRRHPRRGPERDRGAERAPRRGPGRPVLPLPPRAAVERGGARLDGLGAEAREARGAEPAPARRDRHELRRPGGRAERPPGRALLHHARLGHAPPARRREEARRRHRAPAQPPGVRPAPPAASPRATGSCSRASASPPPARPARASRGSSPGTPASTPTPPPSRTPTRTSSARAASRGRGSTTSTPSRRRWRGASPTTCSSRTTSSRGSTPAPAS